jgi:hypothetical protein
MAEKPNHGLYVKKFPGWRIDKTYLDLMYEGQPGDVPPQASGLKALHRDGQTFLTWKEIEDPVGKDEVIWGELKAILDGLDNRAQTRYCVYRSDRPITNAGLAVSTRHNGPSEDARSLQALFGHPDWALKTQSGKDIWEEHDMNRLVAGTPEGVELPLVAITSDNKGPIQEFHRLMLQQGRPIIAEFSWGGTRYIPVTASETFPNAVCLDIRKDRSVLAFSSEAARKTLAGGMGEFNRDVTWHDPLEGPAKYEVVLNCTAHQSDLYDVTLRRLQQFKVAPGRKYHWAAVPLDGDARSARPGRRSHSAKDDVSPATEGAAVAAQNGLLTLKAVPLAVEMKLIVTPE